MEGKIVVITGAARGLGKVLAQSFHDLGARVVLVGRNAATTEEAAREVGPNARAYAADVAEWEQVESAFAAIGKDLGSIDVLVNNAALTNPAVFEKSQLSYLEAMVKTNLLGSIYCCRAALPLLRAAGGGDIVNLSSQSVSSPAPTLAAYMASKAGVEAFSHGLRMEVRPDNIRVGILRVGTMRWNPDDAPRSSEVSEPGGSVDFMALCQREGNLTLLNPGMEHASAAQTVVNMVSLPRDAVIGIVELLPTARM